MKRAISSKTKEFDQERQTEDENIESDSETENEDSIMWLMLADPKKNKIEIIERHRKLFKVRMKLVKSNNADKILEKFPRFTDVLSLVIFVFKFIIKRRWVHVFKFILD